MGIVWVLLGGLAIVLLMRGRTASVPVSAVPPQGIPIYPLPPTVTGQPATPAGANVIQDASKVVATVAAGAAVAGKAVGAVGAILGIGSTTGEVAGSAGIAAAGAGEAAAGAGASAAGAGEAATTAVGGTVAGGVAAGAVAVGVGVLFVRNAIAMFTSLFGGVVVPPEPVRRAAFNNLMSRLYYNPFVQNTGYIETPPLLTNADDLNQLSIMQDWITRAEEIYQAGIGDTSDLRRLALNEAIHPSGATLTIIRQEK